LTKVEEKRNFNTGSTDFVGKLYSLQN